MTHLPIPVRTLLSTYEAKAEFPMSYKICFLKWRFCKKVLGEYQPSGAGGTACNTSPPAESKMADRVWKGVKPYVFWFDHSFFENLTNSKWPLGGPKMADRVWKGVYPQVFGRSHQLLLNKFFDPSLPSIRKVDNRENKLGLSCAKLRGS